MNSIGDDEVSRIPAPGLFRGEIGVDGQLLNDLATCYAQYSHALAGPFDPVVTLALTGNVLQSVRSILTTIGQAPGHCPADQGKAGQ